MRLDTKVFFQSIQREYNADTGDYGETVTEEEEYASVNNTGTEVIRFVYAGIPQESLTIRLQNKHKKPFDYIRIGDKRYKVDRKIDLYQRQSFIVSEVQNGDGY